MKETVDRCRSVGVRRDLGIFPGRSSEFYVVRDATTKMCTVLDKKPTASTTTIVDNGTFETEAETGVKTTEVCLDN